MAQDLDLKTKSDITFVLAPQPPPKTAEEALGILTAFYPDRQADLTILRVAERGEYNKELSMLMSEAGNMPWGSANPVFDRTAKQFFERIHIVVLRILKGNPEALRNTLGQGKLRELVEEYDEHRKKLDAELDKRIKSAAQLGAIKYIPNQDTPENKAAAGQLQEYIVKEFHAIVSSEIDVQKIHDQATSMLSHAPTLGVKIPIDVPQGQREEIVQEILAQSKIFERIAQRNEEFATFVWVDEITKTILEGNPSLPLEEAVVAAKQISLFHDVQKNALASPPAKPANILHTLQSIAKSDGTLTARAQIQTVFTDLVTTILPKAARESFQKGLSDSIAGHILQKTQKALEGAGASVTQSTWYTALLQGSSTNAAAAGQATKGVFYGLGSFFGDAATTVFGHQIDIVTSLYASTLATAQYHPLLFLSGSPSPQWVSLDGALRAAESYHALSDFFSFIRTSPLTTRLLGNIAGTTTSQALVSGAGAAAGGAVVGAAAQTGLRGIFAWIGTSAFGKALGGLLGWLGGPVVAVVGFVFGDKILKAAGGAGSWLMEKLATGGLISGTVGAATSGFKNYIQGAFGAPLPKKTWLDSPMILVAGVVVAVLVVGLMAPGALLGPTLEVAHRNIPLAIGGGREDEPGYLPGPALPDSAGGWPTTGCITQGPFSGVGRSHSGSNAIDIGAATNTPVYAVLGGSVAEVFLAYDLNESCLGKRDCDAKGINVYGNHVIIEGIDANNNHYKTMYGHLLSVDSKIFKGADVHPGQPIGLVDNNGNTDGPHLHFGYSGGALLSGPQTILPVPVPGCYGKPDCERKMGDPDVNGCYEVAA